MSMNKLILTSLVMALTVAQASAQTTSTTTEKTTGSETSMKIEDAKEKNKVDGNIDEEITNARMRAETGSKSKLSVSLTANYLGGSIKEPFAENRANPTNEPTPEKVRMSGDLGLRYRQTKNLSFTAGGGYSVVRPFHGMDKSELSTPSVGANYASKIGPTQNSSDVSLSYATEEDALEIGSTVGVGVGHTVLGNVGQTALTLGLSLAADYTEFDKKTDTATLTDGRSGPAMAFQQNYQLAAYPFLEYAFSDRFQFRTVTRPWIFSHRRAASGWEFNKRPWTQSMGLGIVVTRDIYIYPNFQFVVEDLRRADYNIFRDVVADGTTFGISATVNVF